jgi:hypothetical protein
MSQNPLALWNTWRTSPEIQEMAEAWLTKREQDWTDDHERLYGMMHSDPDRALATILAIMQMTDDMELLFDLAAGPFEDFLGAHGETYVDTIHTLALEQRRLREVLDGVWQGAMPKLIWRRIEILKQSAFS